jgi:hypothetical protein
VECALVNAMIRTIKEPDMRAIVRPLSNPKACIDVTECLLGALAAEISRFSEGNPVLDRLEAEARLDELLGASWRALRGPFPINQTEEDLNAHPEVHDQRADRCLRQPQRQAV